MADEDDGVRAGGTSRGRTAVRPPRERPGWAPRAERVYLRRAEPWLYAPPRDRFVEVEVPGLRYAALDGVGAPDEHDFPAATAALFAVCDVLDETARSRSGRGVPTAPLEVLWTSTTAPHGWTWTAMVRQPAWVDAEQLAEAADRAGLVLPLARAVRLLELAEGRSVQITRVGARSTQAPVLTRLHDEYLPAHGLEPNGRHHEIYLSDPRRTAPNRLRTVLRQPVRASA